MIHGKAVNWSESVLETLWGTKDWPSCHDSKHTWGLAEISTWTVKFCNCVLCLVWESWKSRVISVLIVFVFLMAEIATYWVSVLGISLMTPYRKVILLHKVGNNWGKASICFAVRGVCWLPEHGSMNCWDQSDVEVKLVASKLSVCVCFLQTAVYYFVKTC